MLTDEVAVLHLIGDAKYNMACDVVRAIISTNVNFLELLLWYILSIWAFCKA